MAVVVNKAMFPILIKEIGKTIPYDSKRYDIPDSLLAKYGSLFYIISRTPPPAPKPAEPPSNSELVPISKEGVPPMLQTVPLAYSIRVGTAQVATSPSTPATTQAAPPVDLPLKGVHIKKEKCSKKRKHRLQEAKKEYIVAARRKRQRLIAANTARAQTEATVAS
jgi:hypothetical protein